MSQQAVNLALNIKDILRNNWTLKDQLEKTKITWFSYLPTRKEIRELPLSIAVTFESGTGNPTSLAVSQMADVIKIDFYLSMRNLEGEKTRLIGESNRMLVKNEILKLIHDNQVTVTGIKFNKYIRSARSDEVDSDDTQWFLHEILFVSANWYHTET